MKRLQSVPLAISLPVLLLVSATAAGLTAWWLNARLIDHEIEIQFIEETRFRITRLQSTLEYFFLKNDLNGVKKEVSGMATHQDVVTVYVLNERDLVVAATRYAAIGESAVAILPELPVELKGKSASLIAQVRAERTGIEVISRNQHMVVSYYPLLVDTDEHSMRPIRRGVLVMVSDLQFAKAAAFQAVRRQATEYTLLFGILALFVWGFIHITLTRRVARLVTTTRQFSAGDLNARMGIAGNDELAQVAKAFDLMAAEIAEDIIRREQVAAALLKSEQTSSAIVENAIDAFIAIGDDGRIENWNPQAEAIFGWPRAEAIGLALHETIIPPKLREAHQQGLKRFLATGEGPMLNKRIELTALHKDGHEFPVELTISTLKIQHNITFNAFVRDISDRKRAEAELKDIHGQLGEAFRNAGMAEVDTNVLHNVGNVLNSVNVSASLVTERIQKSKTSGLSKVVALLQEHEHDLGTFITSDTRGKHLPDYLAQLSEHLRAEQEAMATELDSLQSNINHIKEIVTLQQGYAKRSGVKESVNIIDVLENSVSMNIDALSRHGVVIIREFADVPQLTLDRHKVLHILINLIGNAKYACAESGHSDKRLTLRVAHGDGRIQISVIDNGIGILAENLTKIFNHGFTTKKDGHGFGLHSGALAAQELGGSLSAHSDGHGRGATFILDLPMQTAEPTYA